MQFYEAQLVEKVGQVDLRKTLHPKLLLRYVFG